MKCELCHQAEACEVLVRDGDDADNELYVCAACAKTARQDRRKKSQRTRAGAAGADAAPPPVEHLIEAISGFFDNIAKDFGGSPEGKTETAETEGEVYPSAQLDRAYRVKDSFHLEGLHLLGELEAVRRGLEALGFTLKGLSTDGMNDAGHVYRLYYTGSPDRAKRVAGDLLREERNARIRLSHEIPRVLSDSVCRALAILKNCRLLSATELFDLLSPLRLAALDRRLEGMDLAEVEKLQEGIDLSESMDLTPEERDRIDGERADEMNRKFEEVLINDSF